MSANKNGLAAEEDRNKSYIDKQIKKTLIYVGEKIRTEREKQNITREEMEQLTEVSVDTIKRIEVGKSASSENLFRVALALDVPFSVLLPEPPQDKYVIRQKIDKLMDELMEL